MKTLVIALIKIYRYLISPLFLPACRFTPTCSEYSLEAIKKFGVCKGGVMSIRRLLKCHPFNPGGYDPVKK